MYAYVHGDRSLTVLLTQTTPYNGSRSTYVAQFVQITKQILRLRKHQEPFYLHFLQWFHKTLQHIMYNLR